MNLECPHIPIKFGFGVSVTLPSGESGRIIARPNSYSWLIKVDEAEKRVYISELDLRMCNL
jgi:hypothetical protein